MDNIPTGILISLDTTGSSILGNRAARELFGVPGGLDISDKIPAFRASSTGYVVPPEALPLQRAMQWDRMIDAKDYELLRPDGMRRFVTMAAAPLYGSGAQVAGGVAILVDVTYLRTQERSLLIESDELNRLIARELRVAEILQKAHLPLKLPEVDGFSLSAVYQPSDFDQNVGGDWYDAFQLAHGLIGLSVGGVTGTGVAAAVAMAKVRQAIQSAALVRPEPATMLQVANSTLTLHDASTSATAVAGVLNPANGKLTFASAGHPLPLVRERAGYLREFRGVAGPLGDFERGAARTHGATLSPGDLAVFFTDGLVEATQDGISGRHLLRSVLSSGTIPLSEESAELLHREMFDTRSGQDDVVILAIARCGSETGTA